jgi:hypothetical protein
VQHFLAPPDSPATGDVFTLACMKVTTLFSAARRQICHTKLTRFTEVHDLFGNHDLGPVTELLCFTRVQHCSRCASTIRERIDSGGFVAASAPLNSKTELFILFAGD